jgi:hypothetical protein
MNGVVRSEADEDEDQETPNGTTKPPTTAATAGLQSQQRRSVGNLSVPSVPSPPPSPSPAAVLLKEAVAVGVWTLAFPLLRFALAWTARVSQNQQVAGDAAAVPSVLAAWFLACLPSKAKTNQAPGIYCAPFWWSLWTATAPATSVASTTLQYPYSLPVSVCETILRRIKKREWLILTVVHCLVTAVVWYLILPRLLLLLMDAAGTMPMTQAPPLLVSYQDGNPWWMDCVNELLVNAAAVLVLQVLPVLFTLNHCQPAAAWLLTLVLAVYPLYNWSVDSAGQGSTLNPTLLLVQTLTSLIPSISGATSATTCATIGSLLVVHGRVVGRAAAQLAGGAVAGRIMTCYFPDDPNSRRAWD